MFAFPLTHISDLLASSETGKKERSHAPGKQRKPPRERGKKRKKSETDIVLACRNSHVMRKEPISSPSANEQGVKVTNKQLRR